MAARDSFESFNRSLTKEERESARDILESYLGELLSARSEDARMRLVEKYKEDVNEAVVKKNKQQKH